MRQTITKNFLGIVLLLAVGFAFAMRATVFQKELPTTPDRTKPAAAQKPSAEFAAYWFAGKAELNHYRLEQAQYGTLNPGEVTMIFVTEDFLTDKQVKADAPSDRAVPVMKTNISKKFVTGLYDYSLFTSVFTPVAHSLYPNTLKVSTSIQDWCGHSYEQVNYRSNRYEVDGKSYFEKIVDEDYTVGKAMLEDELWNRIRLGPGKLPIGDIKLIPGTMVARLRHQTLEALPATTKLDDYLGVLYPGKFLRAYTVEYPTDNRTLVIVFEKLFPHKIVGWSDTYQSRDSLLTSRAVLTSTTQTDYWNHNAPADSTLRADLMSK